MKNETVKDLGQFEVFEYEFETNDDLIKKIKKNCKNFGKSFAISVLVYDGLDMVLVKNTKPPFSNFWIFPSGGVEPRESFKDAAMREVKEETGLDIKIIGPIMLVKNPKLKGYNTGILVLKGEVVGGKLNKGRNISRIIKTSKLPSNTHPICKKAFNLSQIL